VPSLRTKSGAAWSPAIAAGKVAFKWGSGWVLPSTMKVKWGAGWVDTGYAGYPAAPINVGINYWDYNEVRIQWAAGSGGAPVAAWNVVQTDAAGNWLRSYDLGGSPSPAGYFPVNESTKYRFYVRSKGSTGLYSDWGAGSGVGASIGKPAVTTYTTETGTRPWSAAVSVNGYKDALVGYAVPTNRAVQTVRYQISAYAGFTSALSPYNNREIYRLSNSGQNERFSWLVQSIDTTVDVADYWGNTGITGMICRGTGWASGPATSNARATGTITVAGYETYQYQQAHTTAAVANAYW